MASPYWIEEALKGILPTLWMFLGVGVPWAFAVLSTKHWHSSALVGAMALALGPAWMTAWMLLLGAVGAPLDSRLLTTEWILAGSAVIAGLGALIAWRKRHQFEPADKTSTPLAFDEKLIIALIAIAVVLRWIHTAFWPFTAYDALWVFGYQGRLFLLEGHIPGAIDYYPPFLSLQFTYVQVLIGEINDHAARMVIPLLHIGSILAAYLLGGRLVNRRVGLIAAALWSLHPHVGQWAYVGDLEIPLTFSFTLAAVFFLRAWLEEDDQPARRHEAILAGVMLGIAMFTKPTAGAFVWGVLLLLVVDLIRNRFDLHQWMPRCSVALWTGLACLPLGSVWYLRNLLLGHDIITFPKAVWLTWALRSGDYLAPLVVAAVVIYVVLMIRRKLARRQFGVGTIGIALLLAGAMASNPLISPQRLDPPASYVRIEEAIAMALGLALMAFSLRYQFRSALIPKAGQMLSAGGWALLLALPYFVTFFFSYSYHYRLGFAIVPLLCLPTAIALAEILEPARIRRWRANARRGYHLALLLLCLPGIIAVGTSVSWRSVWLLREELDNDTRKYQVFNPSLMEVVSGLKDYIRDTGNEPVVLAPGEERLQFFFPQLQIIDRPVIRLAEVEALSATHVVYGAKAREAYLEAGHDPAGTQLVSALGRYDLFRLKKEHYDGTFSYELYETADLSGRFEIPGRYARGRQNRIEVVFDKRIRLHAQGAYPPIIFRDTPITFEPTWRALQPLDRDYEFVLRLQDPDAVNAAQEWILRPAAHRSGHYSTLHWELDEFVNELLFLRLDAEAVIPEGDDYVFSIGVWDPQAERFLPLEINGEAAGEFYQLSGVYELET